MTAEQRVIVFSGAVASRGRLLPANDLLLWPVPPRWVLQTMPAWEFPRPVHRAYARSPASPAVNAHPVQRSCLVFLPGPAPAHRPRCLRAPPPSEFLLLSLHMPASAFRVRVVGDPWDQSSRSLAPAIAPSPQTLTAPCTPATAPSHTHVTPSPSASPTALPPLYTPPTASPQAHPPARSEE